MRSRAGCVRRGPRTGRWSRTSGTRACERLLARLDDWPGRVLRVALAATGRCADRVAGRGRSSGRATASWTLERPGATPIRARLGAGRSPQRGECGVRGGRRPGARGGTRTRSRTGWPASGASVAGCRSSASRAASWCSTTTAITRRRSRPRSPLSARPIPGRRVWAVYEPLTYHRTAAMLDAFADVLATADRVVIADIWAGSRPGHDHHQRRRARGGREPCARRMPAIARGYPWRRRRHTWPTRWRPGTWCWSWAGAARMSSRRCSRARSAPLQGPPPDW